MNFYKRFFVFIFFALLAVYYYPLRFQLIHFLTLQLHLHGGIVLFFLVILIWGRLVYTIFFGRLSYSLWIKSQIYLILGFLFTGHIFIFLRLFNRVSWPLVWLFFVSWPVLYAIRFLLRVYKKDVIQGWVQRVMKGISIWQTGSILLFLTLVWGVIFLASGQFPPVTYDGLSYHLAIPHWWLQEGLVADYQYNLYSAMPFHWQSNYALFTLITGQSGQYLHVLTGILGVINIAYILRFFLKLPVVMTCFFSLFIFTLPEYFYLIRQANIDLGLFYILSVLMLTAWNQKTENRNSLLAFWVIGFLIGTKYTAIVIFMLPFLIADFITYKNLKRSFLGVLIICILNAAHYLKNVVLYGNPVYPLFGFIGDESYYDYAFFLQHHTPDRGHIFRPDLFLQPSFLFLMLAATAVIFFTQRSAIHTEKRSQYFWGILLCVFSWLFYSLFTVGTTRFIFPLWAVLIPLLAAVSAKQFYRSGKVLRISFTLYLIACLFWQITFLFAFHPNPLSYFLGVNDRQSALEKNLPGYGNAVSFINDNLEDSSLLFIGEARTYHLNNPQKVTYSTVFNYNPAALLAQESLDYETFIYSIKDQEWEYILVNEIELDRLNKFYGDIWHYISPEKRTVWNSFLEELNNREKVFEYTVPGMQKAIFIVHGYRQ